MPCVYKDRHGLSGEEIQCLSNKFYLMNGRENWDTFDDFLLWCRDNGYRKDRKMRRINKKLPHSKENSYFYDKSKTEEEQTTALHRDEDCCDFCKNCREACAAQNASCIKWREYFVKNWNEKICRRGMKVVREAESVWRYEHPDLVREGIIFVCGN